MAKMRSHTSRRFHEAFPAAGPGVAEDQVDVVGGVLRQQLVAEPQYLCFVGDVTGMARDMDASWSLGSCHGRGLGHGLRVQVAGRDRAALGGQLARELPAHA